MLKIKSTQSENTSLRPENYIKRRLFRSLILNLLITASSLTGTVLSIQKYGFPRILQFYTVDSNLLAAAVCSVYAAFVFRTLLRGKAIPVTVQLLKYFAVCCLSITFVVVIFILAPMQGIGGYKMLFFTDDMFCNHLISPVLALFTFFLFDRIPVKAIKAALLAFIPTGIYTAVIITLNILKVIAGPYPFFMVYIQPLYISVFWFVLILGGAFFLTWVLAKLRRRKELTPAYAETAFKRIFIRG